jgi:hypothetical protein
MNSVAQKTQKALFCNSDAGTAAWNGYDMIVLERSVWNAVVDRSRNTLQNLHKMPKKLERFVERSAPLEGMERSFLL